MAVGGGWGLLIMVIAAGGVWEVEGVWHHLLDIGHYGLSKGGVQVPRHEAKASSSLSQLSLGREDISKDLIWSQVVQL